MKEKERFELSNKIGDLSGKVLLYSIFVIHIDSFIIIHNQENESQKSKYIVEYMISKFQENRAVVTGNSTTTENTTDLCEKDYFDLLKTKSLNLDVNHF